MRSLSSDSGDCSWAWTKIRQSETNSMACFRYAPPIFFIYLTNDSLSKLPLVVGAEEEGMRLDDEGYGWNVGIQDP